MANQLGVVACTKCGSMNENSAVFCIQCGESLVVQPTARDMLKKAGPPVAVKTQTAAQTPSGPARIILTDIDMPFGSMMAFIFKWTLASIPALFLVAALLAAALVTAGVALTALTGFDGVTPRTTLRK